MTENSSPLPKAARKVFEEAVSFHLKQKLDKDPYEVLLDDPETFYNELEEILGRGAEALIRLVGGLLSQRYGVDCTREEFLRLLALSNEFTGPILVKIMEKVANQTREGSPIARSPMAEKARMDYGTEGLKGGGEQMEEILQEAMGFLGSSTVVMMSVLRQELGGKAPAKVLLEEPLKFYKALAFVFGGEEQGENFIKLISIFLHEKHRVYVPPEELINAMKWNDGALVARLMDELMKALAEARTLVVPR